MSLVNDMLNDLDARRATQPDKQVDLEWLSASKTASSQHFIKQYLPFLILLCCVAVVSVLYKPWQFLEQSTAQVANTPVHVVTTPKVIQPRPVQSVSKPVVITQSQDQTIATEKVEQVIEKSIEPEFAVSKQVFAEPVDMQVLEEAVIEDKTPVAKQEQAPVIKKVLPLTPQQKDQKVTKQARELIRSGRASEAIGLLQQQLSEQPASFYTGEILSTLLLSQQRLTETAQLLDQLQSTFPERVELMVIKARLYLQVNESEQALNYLQQQQPNILQYPAYYEMQATAAQRSANYLVAQKTYNQLLKLDGSRADWWFGLAVAFDAQAEKNSALTAYQRAVSQRGLAKKLQQYANQRINVLAVTR